MGKVKEVGLIGGLLLAVVGALALGVHSVRGHRNSGQAARQMESLDRERDGWEAENRRLRQELEALERDPAFVDRLLRESGRGDEGEKRVER